MQRAAAALRGRAASPPSATTRACRLLAFRACLSLARARLQKKEKKEKREHRGDETSGKKRKESAAAGGEPEKKRKRRDEDEEEVRLWRRVRARGEGI